MNIGFVSTWLERGATYVTKAYMEMLNKKHNLFVFARGGEYVDEKLKCEEAEVTYGYRLQGTDINWKQFKKWIVSNNIEMIIFNEQSSMNVVYNIRKYFPKILIGAYIDYYKEDTINNFKYYHFLLCNTKRHYSVFSWHRGAFYLPWGCDLNKFYLRKRSQNSDELVFFHSMGMSNRKGTDILIKAFIDGNFVKKNAKLIIHTQLDISNIISIEEAKNNNIFIINKIVSHPGLYYMGDVYVYPTTLDGLGLTIYEALASGLPVITTNEQPMNEIITDENGKLIDVKYYHSRKDAYYWPLSFVDEDSLIKCMNYYCNNRSQIIEYKKKARKYAEEKLDFKVVEEKLNKIMDEICRNKQNFLENNYFLEKPIDKEYIEAKKIIINKMIPDKISDKIRKIKERNRYKDNERNYKR